MTEKKEYSNIIRVAELEKLSRYEHAILLAMSPEVYNKHNCVKIQVTVAHLPTAEMLIKLFKNAGLEEVNREKKPIKVTPSSGTAYILPNAFEITLEKHPSIRR